MPSWKPPWTLRKVHASGPEPPGAAAVPPELPSAGPERPIRAGDAGPDWAAQAADRIDELVGTIRSNTTDRLITVARWIVLGLLVAVMAVTAGILITIVAVRVLDEMIPGDVWIVYSILGAIFAVSGALLWSQRTPRHSEA